MANWLATNIKYIKGVGPVKAVQLSKLGIYTVADLLEHYPRRYEDRSQLKPIGELADGQVETFQAVILSIDEVRPRRGLTITKVMVRDAAGLALLEWFNQPYKKKWLKPGMELVITGKVQRYYRQVQVQNPEIEIIDGSDMLHTGRIVPVYPATDSISQRQLRSLVRQVLDTCGDIPETLPAEIIKETDLLERATALRNIHFPENTDIITRARYRLVFEELYFLQCGLLLTKQKNKQDCAGIKHAPDGDLVRRIEKEIPFSLTEDQKNVLREIKADMEDITPMQRMVQGDVGSGKTIIAAIALAKTVENGYQGAMMAPTEILAEQHYQTLDRVLSPLGVRLAVLTGNLTRSAREEALAKIKNGTVDVVVGTHALIQESVEFKYLGLVITDEQHRFGVSQRAKLQAKGHMVDVLVMTATPIPRTMALTVYGDIDVSVIRQMPPGRKPVKTYARGSEKRKAVYDFVLSEVDKGRQAYIVCPLVEESEKMEAQAATKLYEQFAQSYFRHIRCGLVHGKLRVSEKDAVMKAFQGGEIKVLIATTVIEVGVNIPNASVMVVEGAERFGLAQLHQLRGRIGRGEYQSYCVLISDAKNPEARERLEIMTTTNDGFILAEQDLLLRGPGQFFGTRQHGMPDLKIADIIKDIDVLIKAKSMAEKTINKPDLLVKVRPVLAERFSENLDKIRHS